MRLIDNEIPGLVLDQYGPCAWFSWSGSSPPDAEAIAELAHIAEEAGLTHWLVNVMVNRGRDPNRVDRVSSDGFPSRWHATDAGMVFELRTDTGLSPGLFLDQRENRLRIRKLAEGCRVLNLFCYTCSLSLSAALGGAKEVVSVDISRRFSEWGQRNFILNGLEGYNNSFWIGDARDFLNLAVKKEAQFEILIIDPPSFSRVGRRVFKVRQELRAMVLSSLPLVPNGGHVMISTNLRTWPSGAFVEEFRRIPGTATKDKPPLMPLPWDFSDNSTASKIIWLSRTSDPAVEARVRR